MACFLGRNVALLLGEPLRRNTIGIPKKPTVPSFRTFSAAAGCAKSASVDAMHTALQTVSNLIKLTSR